MTCTIFSNYLKKMWNTEPVRGNDVFIWWAAIQNTVSPDNNPVPYQSTDWLFYGWRPTCTKWGMTDTHPPLINIYMWIMRLNFLVFAGGSATCFAARSAGYYFTWNLMSAEFIRGSAFPANAGILLAANSLFSQCPLSETCCICHVFSEAPGIQSVEMDMIFVLGSEAAGFLGHVL